MRYQSCCLPPPLLSSPLLSSPLLSSPLLSSPLASSLLLSVTLFNLYSYLIAGSESKCQQVLHRSSYVLFLSFLSFLSSQSPTPTPSFLSSSSLCPESSHSSSLASSTSMTFESQKHKLPWSCTSPTRRFNLSSVLICLVVLLDYLPSPCPLTLPAP